MEIIVTRRSDPNYQRTFKKIRKKKIKEAADISALRARMKAEMDKVAKHRDDVKKHSGKFVDKAKNALKRQKAAQARVDALQDRIIGIKRENVKAALKEGKYHDWRNDDSLSAKQKIGLSMREVKGALDEIISEETFVTLLELSDDYEMSTDIMDEGYEDDDLEDDGLMLM